MDVYAIISSPTELARCVVVALGQPVPMGLDREEVMEARAPLDPFPVQVGAVVPDNDGVRVALAEASVHMLPNEDQEGDVAVWGLLIDHPEGMVGYVVWSMPYTVEADSLGLIVPLQITAIDGRVNDA